MQRLSLMSSWLTQSFIVVLPFTYSFLPLLIYEIKCLPFIPPLNPHHPSNNLTFQSTSIIRLFFRRNPEHSKRPPFSSIVVYLESSDEDLLKWNEGDRIVGRNAHILGASLEESSDLFINLQRVYQNAMLKEQDRKRSKSNVWSSLLAYVFNSFCYYEDL